MQITDAVDLLKNKSLSRPDKQIWYDLGCGTGTFALALAHLLAPESLIFAVDKNENAMKNIPEKYSGVVIEKVHGDFVDIDFNISEINGIMMANSLHFVKDKADFIRKLTGFFKSEHLFLIVEYDNDKSNPWVPYPLSFQSLQSFFISEGYPFVTKLNSRKSMYNSGNIYSALASKNPV